MSKCNACCLTIKSSCYKNNESGNVQNDKCIDKNANDGHQTLFCWVINLGYSVSVRSRSHTSLIREKASGYAITHGFFNCSSNKPTCSGSWIKGPNKDHLEGRDEHLDIHNKDNDSANNIKESHERHYFFCKRCDSANAAEENKACKKSQTNAYIKTGHIECRLERIANRVGLYHIADKTEGNDNSDREKCGKSLASKSLTDVIGWPTYNLSVHVSFFIYLGKDSLCKNRAHAKESADPHPENGARSTRCYSRSSSCEVTCSNLSCNCRGQRLERRHPFLSGFLSKESYSTKGMATSISKLP